MANLAESFFEGVDTFFAWLSASLKQTTESYCELETADSPTVLVNHDGSLLSVIRVDGITTLLGNEEFQRLIEGVTCMPPSLNYVIHTMRLFVRF